MKVLRHIPEVRDAAMNSKGGTESEMGEIFNEVWKELEPHIPKENNRANRCIRKLLRLHSDLRLKMRMSLASYEFEFYEPGTPFDISTMSIVHVPEGEYEQEELRRLDKESRGRDIVVGFCFFPTLCKWGNDQGYDLKKPSIIHRARVLPLYDDDSLVRLYGRAC
jgi:hypothetical protein